MGPSSDLGACPKRRSNGGKHGDADIAPSLDPTTDTSKLTVAVDGTESVTYRQ